MVGAAMWLPPLHSERSHLRKETQGAPPWRLTQLACLPACLTAWAEAKSAALSSEERRRALRRRILALAPCEVGGLACPWLRRRR